MHTPHRQVHVHAHHEKQNKVCKIESTVFTKAPAAVTLRHAISILYLIMVTICMAAANCPSNSFTQKGNVLRHNK